MSDYSISQIMEGYLKLSIISHVKTLLSKKNNEQNTAGYSNVQSFTRTPHKKSFGLIPFSLQLDYLFGTLKMLSKCSTGISAKAVSSINSKLYLESNWVGEEG
jgi:hypothetical protein